VERWPVFFFYDIETWDPMLKGFYNSNEEKTGKVYQARNICPKEWRE
jgi:hypothetical protein